MKACCKRAARTCVHAGMACVPSQPSIGEHARPAGVHRATTNPPTSSTSCSSDTSRCLLALGGRVSREGSPMGPRFHLEPSGVCSGGWQASLCRLCRYQLEGSMP